MSKENGSAAMVVVDDLGFRRQMEPSSIDGLLRVAAMAAKIRLGGIASPEEAVIRMIAGRELGLTQTVSLLEVYVIDGKPSLSAKAKQAICEAHPDVCELFEYLESSDKKATYRVKRRGQEPKTFTFTIEDAARAGLTSRGDKSNWAKYPQRMLEARAKSHAADVVFGDLLLGFGTREDLLDEREARDPNVIDTVPLAPDSGPQVSGPPRDIDAEAADLKQAIADAKTPDEKKAVRARIVTFGADVGEPWKGDVERCYNAMHVPHKVAGQNATPAPGAVAETG